MKDEISKNQAKNIPNEEAETWKRRFWVSTVSLLTVIALLLVGGTSYLLNLKNNVVSDAELATLEVFDEVATPFLQQFEFDREKPEDGDFYISFKYYVQNDDGSYDYNNGKSGKVYFWTDKQDGHRSYGFSYD